MAARHMTEAGESGGRRLLVLPGGRTAAQQEEDALLGAWLVGDHEAFGELVRRHQVLVLAIVRRYSASPEDARDLVQRTFLRALESARRTLVRGHRNAVPFRRWLIRVAVNLAKNHRRDATRWTTTSLELPAVAAHGASAPEALERAQTAARVRRAALALPRRQREVLTLRIDAELPFAEIGEVLDISENAAKVSFHLAVTRLRAELAQEDA
ncbi:MAG TPA: sigma-70 family RNA polymerase sigma factor [Anaeromyxobacteraceae bacterium]